MSEAPSGVAIPDTRLHPVYLVTGTAKTLRQAIPYLVVTIFGGAPWWVNAGLFAVVMLVAVAHWHVEKYAVVGGALVLSGGLINRSMRVLPLTRIAVVTASQSFSQRFIGVWRLSVQTPGDRSSSAVTLACLSGRRLDELRAALESTDETVIRVVEPTLVRNRSPIKRYLAWRRTSAGATPTADPRSIAVLNMTEMVFAAATNNSILLIFLAELLLWFRFSRYVPSRASSFMERTVEPHGSAAVVITLAFVAIVVGIAVGTRLHRFTLTRDGESLHTSHGLLGRRSATIPVARVQAVRIVEGLWRIPFGYCRLEVELAGVGVASAGEHLLFPLVRADRVEAFVRRALPELPRPGLPLKSLPTRVRRRYLKLPLGYAAGLALLMLFLPGWWALLAAVPIPVGCLLGVARAREARWLVDGRCVVLRWRWFVNRHTVIAHRAGGQVVELSTSRRKAKAGVAGFSMRFSSFRTATIRYMVASDALLLLRATGRISAVSGPEIMGGSTPVVPVDDGSAAAASPPRRRRRGPRLFR